MLFDLNSYFENVAVISDIDQRIKYSELYEQSTILFEKINERTLVFCLCENSIESLTGYVAFINNRVVPLMLDAALENDLFFNLLFTYSPGYIWLPAKLFPIIPNYEEVYRFHEYRLLKFKSERSLLLNDSLAMLLTTSGSTGSPKLVRLSYENIIANAQSIAQYLDITVNERPITMLPMHYSFGLSIINSHLIRGATLLLTNRSIFDKELWRFLKDNLATSMSGVPYTFEMLKRLRFFRLDLPALRTLTQAGGRLSVELQKEFTEYCHQNDKRFIVMYGQTEATARMSYLPFETALNKLGSIGIAIPGGEFSLIDDNGSLISTSEKAGELIYTGKNVSMGYAECIDDLNKEDENNEKLFTGDIAKRDADDFYYIVGRKKRFIKIYGNRVNLDEAERLIKTIIRECACIGIDDHMVVYITESGRELEVKSFISKKTGINHSAFDVRFCPAIPKNTSGKTLYASLKY